MHLMGVSTTPESSKVAALRALADERRVLALGVVNTGVGCAPGEGCVLPLPPVPAPLTRGEGRVVSSGERGDDARVAGGAREPALETEVA